METAKPRQQRRPWAANLANYAGLLVFLAILVVLFSILSDRFFTRATFNALANQIPALTVIAVGMTFVIIIAGIDLSVGSLMGFSGAMLGLAAVDWHWPVPLAFPVALGCGFVCGLISGAISIRWAIPSFIVTLGMLEVARGGSYLATDSQTKYIGSAIEWVSTPIGDLGVSWAFLVALLVVAAGQFMLVRSVWGRYALAVGANETVVVYSGINPKPLKIGIFALSGLLCGLAAIFNCSKLSSADPNAGAGLELQAIAAVVIGGTSLMGGKGSVISTFLGVLLISVLDYGLAQLGAQDYIKRMVTGAVIIVAVIIDAYRNRIAGGPLAIFRKLISRPAVALT